ncbi:hypothetical protein C8J57DRAFT_684102 [Mycena rebaudengoi]|nr:hypothetical protein C8J57DRAFT_684102 [Mycena rebaudengoi]
MGSDPMLVNAGTVVNNFCSTQYCQRYLHSLSTHHMHQTRLVCEIFARIRDSLKEHARESQLAEGSPFVTDILAAHRFIIRLERALKGGPLMVWFQARESQEELKRIQLIIGPYEKEYDEKELKYRVEEAINKDNKSRRNQIQELTEKIHLKKGRLFFRRTSESRVSTLLDLPALLPQDAHKHDDPEYWFTFKSVLAKFDPPSDPNLAGLWVALQEYLDSKIQSHKFPPLKLQAIRKPSGNIVTVMRGNNTCDDIHSAYCPDVKKLNELPVLYTRSSHSESPDTFVVATQAIDDRPDSIKYVYWDGTGNSTRPPDIYFVEKIGSDAFILATLLGKDIESDVIVPLPQCSSAVKDAIQQPHGTTWITDDGWVKYQMDGLTCKDPRFRPYNHQIFVPGPLFMH